MCKVYKTFWFSSDAFLLELLGIPGSLISDDKSTKVVRPTDPVPVIRKAKEGYEQVELRWGLVPAWSKLMPERPLTNARAETVDELKSFAESFRRRRCIMPGIEFYEWAKTSKKRRTFTPADQEFLFAGLWDAWSDDSTIIESCVMLTTSANEIVAPVHDRMPVILKPDDAVKWLNDDTPIEELRKLLIPLAPDLISLVPDSTEPTAQTSLF